MPGPLQGPLGRIPEMDVPPPVVSDAVVSAHMTRQTVLFDELQSSSHVERLAADELRSRRQGRLLLYRVSIPECCARSLLTKLEWLG